MSAKIDGVPPAQVSQDDGHFRLTETNERRSRPRLHLEWKLLFLNVEGESVDARTLDISSDGFLCLCSRAFSPGQSAICRLQVPRCDPDQPGSAMSLDCRVKIVRVTPADAYGRFGVGCVIEDYRLT